MTVLAIGLVATITPLTSVTLASVPTEHSGLASAINNAVSRLAALMSIGSVGLISVGAASATGFAHVLEVSAALFALGALCAALLITNPAAGCQPCPATSRRYAATGPVCSPPWPAVARPRPNHPLRSVVYDRRNPTPLRHSLIRPRFGSRRRSTHPGEQAVGVMTAHPVWTQSQYDQIRVGSRFALSLS